jgi:sigma-B regulation protein RsbU (phosphoserine phosphatase)
MADVTGHAMEAAVPVMMFSGVLKNEVRHDSSIDALFANLNETMHESLDKRTYVCFTMVELDLADRRLQLSNSGCPYPYHYHSSTGDVTELQVDAYPLGIRAETAYTAIEGNMETGDYLVFCSDGIIEAANIDEDIFGFEQTAETIQKACSDGLSAEALIDHLIGSVQEFAGDEPQGDDMTCVVLRVES